jgi:hypothetical protein
MRRCVALQTHCKPVFVSTTLPLLQRHSFFRYLRVYCDTLDDAGFVEEKPGFWREMTQFLLSLCSSSSMTKTIFKLRWIKFLYFTIMLLAGTGVVGYLLFETIRGHMQLSYPSRQQPLTDGLMPPLFAVCHSMFVIDRFSPLTPPCSSPPHPPHLPTTSASASAPALTASE